MFCGLVWLNSKAAGRVLLLLLLRRRPHTRTHSHTPPWRRSVAAAADGAAHLRAIHLSSSFSLALVFFPFSSMRSPLPRALQPPQVVVGPGIVLIIKAAPLRTHSLDRSLACAYINHSSQSRILVADYKM